MTAIARIFISLGLMFLVLFITIFVLLGLLPTRLSSTQPFLDKGQLSLGTFITGALATGGLITGIIIEFVTAGLEEFEKKRDKDKGERVRG